MPENSSRVRSLVLTVFLILVLACNLPGSGTPPGATVSAPLTFAPLDEVATQTVAPEAVATPTDAAHVAAFRVAVIVDTASEPVTREQAQRLIDDADANFRALTGFSMEMVDFVEDGAGGSTTDMANRYIQSYASVFPHGVVIFSFGDNGFARERGGYAYAIPGAAGFHNAFVSPATGDGHVYVAVVHFSHRYAACGYGGLDDVQSAVSIGGECRNQPGVACVQHNGYSMCSDAVDNLYASTPTYFAASTIVHEILHPFSPGGDQDHFATPECSARMGWPEGYFDLAEAEHYNGMCPFVYENFKSSHQP